MSLHFNDVAKQGFAKVKNKLGLWIPVWLIMRRPSSKGPLRIDQFSDEKASMLMESPGKIIELKNIRQISRLAKDEKKHALAIMFEIGKVFQMALDSESEADAWLAVLREFCASSTRRSGPIGMDLLSNSNMEDVFNVCLLQTPALNVYGECLLQVTSESIYLLDAEPPSKRIMDWPLNALRRYSRDPTMFTFESGRSCKTGEGLFIFNTVHGEEIYQKVWSASNAIAEAYRLRQQGIHQDPRRPLPPVPATQGLPPLPARRH